jgi:hypothetical protein
MLPRWFPSILVRSGLDAGFKTVLVYCVGAQGCRCHYNGRLRLADLPNWDWYDISAHPNAFAFSLPDVGMDKQMASKDPVVRDVWGRHVRGISTDIPGTPGSSTPRRPAALDFTENHRTSAPGLAWRRQATAAQACGNHAVEKCYGGDLAMSNARQRRSSSRFDQ